jgi:hypothetical protein
LSKDLSTLLSIRRVLESAGEGKGAARSIVEELGGVRPEGEAAARLVLLGHPLRTSLGPMVDSRSEEVAMLSSLIVSGPKSSMSAVGKSGSMLATTLERWVKARENRVLEQKAMRFRSLVMSGVLGAVAAMVASVGPLVGGLAMGGAPGAGGSLLYGAAAMTAISSAMLGAFLSGRGLFLNVGVSLAVFAAVSSVAAPLASIPPVTF